MTKLKRRLLFVVFGAVLLIGAVFALGNTSASASAAEIEEQPYALLSAVKTDCEH